MSALNCHFVCTVGLKQICTFQPVDVAAGPAAGVPMVVSHMDHNTVPSHALVNPLPNRTPTVYVQSHHLGTFVERSLPTMPGRFVLVYGDSDSQIDLHHPTFRPLFHSPKVVHIYAQNGGPAHPKLTVLPIGMDYHTKTRHRLPLLLPSLVASELRRTLEYELSTPTIQDTELKRILATAKPFSERLALCFSNFDDKVRSRVSAHRDTNKSLVVEFPHDSSRKDTWEAQSKYAFVLSPKGAGIDCHRTWEALALGCIPIVERSPICSVFEDLPVLIIDSWKDVTRQLLDKTIADFGERKFCMEKLTLRYWIQRIISH